MKRKILIYLGLASLLFQACTKNSDTEAGPENVYGDQVRLEVISSGVDFTTPVTRAGMAQEGLVDLAPWVFVFDGNDENTAVFSEVSKSQRIDDKTYVDLTKKETPCLILLLANVPASFRDGAGVKAFDAVNLAAVLSGVTFQEAVTQKLNTVLLDSPANEGVPYTNPSSPLPMAGMWTTDKIDPATRLGEVGNGIVLQRMLAKVTVTNEVDPATFTLHSATLINAPRNGWFYRKGSDALKNNTGNLTKYVNSGSEENVAQAGPGQDTKANPLYVYESRKEENTALMVYGTYNGESGWYKLAFRTDDGTLLDILRNRNYEFVIGSVSESGYARFEDAVAGEPSNQLSVTIIITDINSHEIQDNGDFFLSVSNSEFIIYHDNALAEASAELAVTVTTDAPVGTLPNRITVSGNGLSSTNTGTANALALTGSATATDISVYFTSAFTSGTITIELGDMVKVITVKREPRLIPLGQAVAFAGNYTGGQVADGQEWFGVSFSNDLKSGTEAVNSSGTGRPMYVIASYNGYMHYQEGDEKEHFGTVFLNRSDNGGRTRVKLRQRYVSHLYYHGYVGTFHRWNEDEERLIHIDYTEGSQYRIPTNGAWTATVVIGADFICMDDNFGGRTYPYLGSAVGQTPVSPNSTVSGVATAASPIRFRVGMKSKLSSATDKPRYGVIHLTFNNNEKSQLVWVRQGEAPDKICGSGVWSPYNLKYPYYYDGGTLLSGHGLLSLVSRPIFEDYPTKAGSLFQWNGGGIGNYAFHPSLPATGAITGYPITDITSWLLSGEPCPTGYSSPDSEQMGSYYNNDSALLISLINDRSTSYAWNSSWGFYADGYYDRLERKVSITQSLDNSTDPGYYVGSSMYIAHNGTVVYNPETMSSLFLPGSGCRIKELETDPTKLGVLHASSTGGFYWSKTIDSRNHTGTGDWKPSFYLGVSKRLMYMGISDRRDAFSVRCVKN